MIGRFAGEVLNDERSFERVELLLRGCLPFLQPTPSFRLRAWREFQRALDPLALPRPLPLERA